MLCTWEKQQGAHSGHKQCSVECDLYMASFRTTLLSYLTKFDQINACFPTENRPALVVSGHVNLLHTWSMRQLLLSLVARVMNEASVSLTASTWYSA